MQWRQCAGAAGACEKVRLLCATGVCACCARASELPLRGATAGRPTTKSNLVPVLFSFLSVSCRRINGTESFARLIAGQQKRASKRIIFYPANVTFARLSRIHFPLINVCVCVCARQSEWREPKTLVTSHSSTWI